MGDSEHDWMEYANDDLSHVRLSKATKTDNFEDECQILDYPMIKSETTTTLDEDSDDQAARYKSAFIQDQLYIDPSRLSDQQVVCQLFQGLSPGNLNAQPVHFRLNDASDFAEFAKAISERVEEEQAGEKLEEFAEELLLHLDASLRAEDLDEVSSKLKVLKFEKKKEEREKQRFSKKKKAKARKTTQDDFM